MATQATSGDAGVEPAVRYVRTRDGVNIAYCTHGTGPALVQMPSFPVSNLQIEWRSRRYRSWWEKLAFDKTLVRYDCRGAGLSDRDVKDYSLPALVGDLEAVVDKLALEKFALLGFGHLGPAAITYATQHPERVSHLILWYTYARGVDYSRAPRIEAGRSLIEKDWQLYTELEGHRATGGLGGSAAQRYTAFLRQSVSPAGLSAAFMAIRSVDVTGLLARVKVPTLVMHRRQSSLAVDVARELAASIPDARLVLLEGGPPAPFIADADTMIAEMRSFLTDQPLSRSLPDGISPREGEVLGLIAAGRSNREIAEAFGISERTVARHITNLYQKIGARNKADATAYALRNNLVAR
jgi:pimeloyl-ACP methyl ester carboxylesterase/DNA-binding CsgD family transcriptional regulator